MTGIERSQSLVLTPVGLIEAHPDNPRRSLGDLVDLTASIEAVGILEPLVLAPHHEDHDRLVLVAGHRRLAAAVAAGMERVPCVICPDLVTEAAQLEVMLAENLQRSDLTPLDEAGAYERLKALGVKQRDLGARVHRSQSHVSKRLSLLRLPDRARELLADGTISLQTALGLTGLVKHPDRLDRALAYAGPGEHSDGMDARVAVACKRELDNVAAEKQQKEQEERIAAAEKEMAALRKQLVKKGLVDLDALSDATAPDDEFDWDAWDECDELDATAFELCRLWSEGASLVVTTWYRPAQDIEASETPAAPSYTRDDRHRDARAAALDRVVAAVDSGDHGIDVGALAAWTLLVLADVDGWLVDVVDELDARTDTDDDVRAYLHRAWHDPELRDRAAIRVALRYASALPSGAAVILCDHGGYRASVEEQAAIAEWRTPPVETVDTAPPPPVEPDLAAGPPAPAPRAGSVMEQACRDLLGLLDAPPAEIVGELAAGVTPARAREIYGVLYAAGGWSETLPWRSYDRHTPKMIRGVLDKDPSAERCRSVIAYESAHKGRDDVLAHAQGLLAAQADVEEGAA